MTFSALQFPFNRGPDKICSVLAIVQYGIDPFERPIGEPGLHVLCPAPNPSHLFFSYELLTANKSYEIRKEQSTGHLQMTSSERLILAFLAHARQIDTDGRFVRSDIEKATGLKYQQVKRACLSLVGKKLIAWGGGYYATTTNQGV